MDKIAAIAKERPVFFREVL
ncbi:Hypothetical protein BIBO2_2740 [Brucella sp. BO2]|nr:Hypothetical protein BIBO2_2740 [Brucella sp. BO2]